ncbi:MAG: hypothetical protein L0241_09505 [Planctomycetia bacterium]|nr:hypothetical protein [Planctomycetia bacterium]
MSQGADIEVRYRYRWACGPLILTFIVALTGFVIAGSGCQGRRARLSDVDWFGLLLLGIALLMFVGIVYHLADRGVKLALTASGLEDRRDNVSIKWTDVHGVRLVFTTVIPSGEVYRTLFVKARVGEEIKEFIIDVKHLDVDPELIANVAHHRSLMALVNLLGEVAPETVTVESISAALNAGVALSDLINDLNDQGLDLNVATQAVEFIAGYELARCVHCRLKYLGRIRVCGTCGTQLEPCKTNY